MWWLFVAFLALQKCTPLRDPFGATRTCSELRDPFAHGLKIPDLSIDPEDRIKTNELRIPSELELRIPSELR
jgi:hypothetical protein